MAPPDPQGPWCEQLWIYILSESFHVNMRYFGSVVLEKIFKWPPSHFCIFAINSPLKRIWPFIWTFYNSLYPRMIYSTFDWNWPAGSGDDFFFLNFQCICTVFCYHLPLDKGLPLHLKNLKSPPPKDDLCQVWLKLAQWFWRWSRKRKSFYRQTDNGRSEKLTWAITSGEPNIWCNTGQ
jgi:hypothetical protein